MTRRGLAVVAGVALLVLVKALVGCATSMNGVSASVGGVPVFEVDPFWPKPLPNNWLMGQAAGVAVDKRNHVWVVQRPKSLTDDEKGATLTPPRSLCCRPAPPVLEFDQAGALVGSWGGPAAGQPWPDNEHGITVDAQDNVWLAGNGPKDGMILKFTRDGKHVLTIGQPGVVGDDADTAHMNRPSNVAVDIAAGEIFVADGYGNHRVIVFDTRTGAYKRHWGAYGKRPDDGYFTRSGERLPSPFSGRVQHEDKPSQYEPDGPPPPQFRVVHAVRLSRDGLVYVCDRTNDR